MLHYTKGSTLKKVHLTNSSMYTVSNTDDVLSRVQSSKGIITVYGVFEDIKGLWAYLNQLYILVVFYCNYNVY